MESKTLLEKSTANLLSDALAKGLPAGAMVGLGGCTIRAALSNGSIRSFSAYGVEGLLAFVVVTTFYYFINSNKKKKIIEEKKREEDHERQKIEIEERRFDRIVNCPYCSGTGDAVLQTIVSGNDGETNWHSILDRQDYINNKSNYTDFANEAKNNSCRIYYKDIQCPYCKGQGISFAWFEKIGAHSDKCGTCGGGGKVKKKLKLDVGVEEAQVNCDQCNGSGKIEIPEKEIVNMKTIGDYTRGESGAYMEIDTPHFANIVIGEKDFDLGVVERSRFIKSKPRFKE